MNKKLQNIIISPTKSAFSVVGLGRAVDMKPNTIRNAFWQSFRKMGAQWLRTLAILVEDLALIPNTQLEAHSQLSSVQEN